MMKNVVFLIFGITGDLAKRKLIPALYLLQKKGKLDEQYTGCKIVGIVRKDKRYSTNEENEKSTKNKIQQAKSNIKQYLQDNIKNFESSIWNDLQNKMEFYPLDIPNPDSFKDLANFLENNFGKDFRAISYLALPPSIYESICECLYKSSLSKKPHNVVLEKPIGYDFLSSKKINDAVANFFEEEQIYRIDHYLGKPALEYLLSLRCNKGPKINTWQEDYSKIWNKDYIEQVQINISETIGIEGRWSYFAQTGELKDMVQNHILQLLSLTAMEPVDFKDIRLAKIKVLEDLRDIKGNEDSVAVVKGQYAKSSTKNIPGYIDELQEYEKDNPKAPLTWRNCETFVAIRSYIDNERWHKVPFYLRAGKRLNNNIACINILFKKGIEEKRPHLLSLVLQPRPCVVKRILGEDEIYITDIPAIEFEQPYERLIYDIICKNHSSFVHVDEVSNAWKWIDQIVKAWHKLPLEHYEAGSVGPKGADDILLNHKWFYDPTKP